LIANADTARRVPTIEIQTFSLYP